MFGVFPIGDWAFETEVTLVLAESAAILDLSSVNAVDWLGVEVMGVADVFAEVVSMGAIEIAAEEGSDTCTWYNFFPFADVPTV
jgi:hypothetical protein